MNYNTIFLTLFSVFVSSYVHCAREMNAPYEATYSKCYYLNEKNSSIFIGALSLQLELDRICLAADRITYKFVSSPSLFPIEYPFDDAKIVRMDNQLMALNARLTQWNEYETAFVEFEEPTEAELLFDQFFNRNTYEREELSVIPLLKKVGKMSAPAVSKYINYETRQDVSLNFFEHGNERTFIIEKGHLIHLVFSESRFQFSRIVNEQFIIMTVEGFPSSFYILSFNEPRDAIEFKGKLIEYASTQNELEFPEKLNEHICM